MHQRNVHVFKVHIWHCNHQNKKLDMQVFWGCFPKYHIIFTALCPALLPNSPIRFMALRYAPKVPQVAWRPYIVCLPLKITQKMERKMCTCVAFWAFIGKIVNILLTNIFTVFTFPGNFISAFFHFRFYSPTGNIDAQVIKVRLT
jgi:hypothetical protein